MKRKWELGLIPAGITLVACVIAVVSTNRSLDWRLYDAMLHLRKAPREDPAILLVDIDDEAIAKIGSWPIGRDIVGDGLASMGELGAETALFDIEYVDKSPRGINARYLEEELPVSFKEGFGSVAENVAALFSAVSSGQLPVSDAKEYAEDLVSLSQTIKDELLAQVSKVAQDNDERLALGAEFFGNAYFTVNMRKEGFPNGDERDKREAQDLAGVPIEKAEQGLLRSAVDLVPTISIILSRSAGAGFPNVYVDPDGVRRRIDLFYEYDGKRFSQLVVAPLLAKLGNPEIITTKQTFRLNGATLPSGKKTDIVIPRTDDGRMLINWSHGSYMDSFKHLSFDLFIQYETLFADLEHNLRARDDWGYLSAYDGDAPLVSLFTSIQGQRRSWMQGEEKMPGDARAILDKKRSFALAEAERFFSERPEDSILQQIDDALSSGRLSEGARVQYETIKADAPVYFEKTRKILEDLVALRGRLKEELTGAFCIIGYTGTGTTDIGVNPFAGEYVNVGTHAAVLNTILQGDFLDDVPSWIPMLISGLASFGLFFLIWGKKPLIEIGVGIAFTLLLGSIYVLMFLSTGVFAAPFLPLASAFFTFLTLTIVSFLQTEREKGFLRSAFSRYLSNDVIKELISDPDKLKLGGTKREMTAMFTDIRGFTTISEKLSPEELVSLLNAYLTGMSDVILDLQGTIDKYEGDAIIAFFGAPLDLEDHAERACRAAVAMKRLEKSLNEQFLSGGMATKPLLTRVGINSGDMVVGNMGTDRKMDYTIIGDAVNLASRLEGVNKQYGTWICASEATAAAAGTDLYFRSLDKIRVVGKSQPIRILELVDIKSSMDAADLEFYEEFHQALKVFERREWERAAQLFSTLLTAKAEDGPSKVYLERSSMYCSKPPKSDWDGVYNLTTK